MKKILLIISTLCLLSSCVDRDPKKPYVKKGDGSVFYNELKPMGHVRYWTHHSTLDCPAIQGGVERNVVRSGTVNLFCPVCMDDHLIDIFNDRFGS